MGRPTSLTIAGVLGIAFYVSRGVELELRGDLPHVLWSCHLGCLLAGVGILAKRPRLVGVGLLFTVLGLPFWVLDQVLRRDFQVTSMLTHVGGLAIAAAGVRRLGMAHGSWWRAAAGLVALHLISRVVTPAAENVNLSSRYWFGWEAEYVSYAVYLAIMLALATAAFAGVECAVRLICCAGRDQREERIE